MSADESELPARLARVLEPRREILEAYLFGSRARGESGPTSDTDVAVFLDRGRAREGPFGYAAELASAVGSELGVTEVDVVVLNDASPLLYHRVLREGQRIFARELTATTTREGRALSRYCDYLPQLHKIEAAHAARMARGDFGR
jgi:predicted nucleotidyltransferase